MARVSIYVPDHMKARMDEAGDAVNWSEIARPAFQAAVANYEHKKGRNMSTAIERLRASKQKYVQLAHSEGHQDGRSWAENSAEYAELQRVAAIQLEGGMEREATNALKNAVDPENELSWRDFKEQVFGESEKDLPSEYVDAFIEGAQELFEEIRDQL